MCGYQLNELTVGEELGRLGRLYRDALRFRVEDLWVIQVSAYAVPSGPLVFSIAATPDMLICSRAGLITLGSQRYACASTAAIRVNDCDPNLDPEVLETTTVSHHRGSTAVPTAAFLGRESQGRVLPGPPCAASA